MSAEVIWQEPETGRRLTRSSAPSEQTRAILATTVWGSRATQYRILDIAEKLARFRDPSYFVLSEADRELCVFVLDRCTKRVSGTDCDAFHFAMAATLPAYRNQGLAGILAEKIRDHCLRTLRPPGLGFAYVEATTEFSLRLSDQIGHAIEADIPLTLFTRLFPRYDPRIGRLHRDELAEMCDRLEAVYQGHELADFAASLSCEDYRVVRDGSDILAGAQAEALIWSVVSMPGASGWLLLNLLPHLPGLNRMLDLRNLTIVRLGNLYFAPGREGALTTLLDSILAEHGARIGLILLDGRSPVLRRIRDHGRRGLLSGALAGSVKLRMDTVGMDETMLARLSARPLLVSSADVF